MTKPLKILVVSYCFAPQNTIGAIRPTKLAKYWTRMGHEVTVLCGPGSGQRQDPTLVRDLKELPHVHVVWEWNPIRAYGQRKRDVGVGQAPGAVPSASVSAEPRRAFGGFRRRILNAVYLALCYGADRSFARRGWRALRQMGQRFDVVLSSYGPLSSHQIAEKVKANGLAERWIADFRDEVQMPVAWLRGAKKRYIRKVRAWADGICAGSQGLLDTMKLADVGWMIPNGFDVEDIQDLPALAMPKSRAFLRFAYCGQIYRGKQDMTPFFEALQSLVKGGTVATKDIQVLYAGGEGDVFTAQAKAAGMGEVVVDLGRLNRGQALALQQQVDMLLMAAWNTKERVGVLTGKLLEYMMMAKPVVCCVSGEIPNSAAGQVIRETGLGYCWEEADAKAADQGLLDYLKMMVQRARLGQPLAQERNAAQMERYAYPAIASELIVRMEEGIP